MKYHKAILILRDRIEILKKELIKTEAIMEETEMQCDYIFAQSDRANIEADINTFIEVINILKQFK